MINPPKNMPVSAVSHSVIALWPNSAASSVRKMSNISKGDFCNAVRFQKEKRAEKIPALSKGQI
jgi:hypothetical protein